jgi:hypothetical protein
MVLPPLGPVDEIVSKERPLDSLFSLRTNRISTESPGIDSGTHPRYASNFSAASNSVSLTPACSCSSSHAKYRAYRTEKCQIVSSGWRRAYERRAVSDVTLAHSFELDLSVRHQSDVRRVGRGLTEFFSALASSIGDGRIAMLSYTISSASDPRPEM